MHHHLEIIMPPTEDVESAVAQIMAPFDENRDDEDSVSHAFWDWYVIGGRWAGAKLNYMIDSDQKEKFDAKLTEMKITVSGVQCGKQELSPASQVPIVDALWNEMFPDSPVKVCPFFSHFNNQYENSDGYPDIMRLEQTPKTIKASHIIIAGPAWNDDTKMEAKLMQQESIWNGVNYIDSKWDGLVFSAVDEYRNKLDGYKPEYVAKHLPTDDWLVVTVDYHS